MKKNAKLISIVLVVLIIAFGGIAYYYSQKNKGEKPYYAVFLDNNQVYFGHIDKERSANIIMSDIFYLQLNSQDQLQNTDASKNSATLIKLGNELHGPEDQMTINRDHVMFYEKLKDDSTVINKIVEYKAGKK